MTDNITKEQKDKALAVISQTADSKLETHLNACVRCGLCADSCMYYLTMKEKSISSVLSTGVTGHGREPHSRSYSEPGNWIKKCATR